MNSNKNYTYIDLDLLLLFKNFIDNKRIVMLKAYASKGQLKDFYNLMDKIEKKIKELSYTKSHNLKNSDEIKDDIINFIYILRNSHVVGGIMNDFLKMYTDK